MKTAEKIILAGAVIFASSSTAILLLTSYLALTNTSLISLLGFGTSILLWTPVWKLIGKVEEPLDSLNSFYTGKKTSITLTGLVFSLTSLSLLTGLKIPVIELLNFSFLASTRLFQQLNYLGSPLTGAGSLLYEFGRFYFHLFLIYSITDTLVKIVRKIKPEKEEFEFTASLIPFTSKKAEIEIYVVTGLHGFFRIPESFCKECNLFYQAAKRAAEEAEGEVEIEVKSYWTRFLRPLLKGGYHAPVILVDGKKVSQGYDVPDKEELLDKLE